MSLSTAITAATTPVVNTVTPVVNAVLNPVVTAVTPVVGTVTQATGGIVPSVVGTVTGTVGTVTGATGAIVDPLLGLVNGVLNNSVKLLDSATADPAFLSTVATELGTALSQVIDGTNSIASKISGVITALTNGGLGSSITAPLGVAATEIDTLLSQLSPISSPSVDRLKSILTALNTDLGTLVGGAGALSATQLLSTLSPITADFKLLNDGLVKKLVSDLDKSLAGLLGNASTLQGLTAAVGSDTATSVQQLFSGLSNVIKSLPTLNTPTALSSALQSTVKDAVAVADKLLGLSAGNAGSQVSDTLKGLTNELTGIINNATSGTFPAITDLTNSLTPLTEKIDGILDALRGVSGSSQNSSRDTPSDVLKGTPAIAPASPDFNAGKRGLTIRGTQHRDNLKGSDLNDVMLGKNDRDRLLGKGGNDRIFGGKGNDRISGGEGDDLLNGGAGKDVLIGNGGNDVLIGGKGNDRLIGGAGKDTFVFGSLNGGVDIIKGFEVSSDLIDLRGIFNHLGASSKDLSQVIKLEQFGSTTELKIAKDGFGASTAFSTIAKLTNVSALTLSASNFVVS